jgi:Protein of unknown function (DUF3618)
VDNDTTVIRKDIEASRRELGETVGLLQQRLNIRRRSSTPSRNGSGSLPPVVQKAITWTKAHPAQATLVAVALRWALRRRRR